MQPELKITRINKLFIIKQYLHNLHVQRQGNFVMVETSKNTTMWTHSTMVKCFILIF